MLIQGVFFLLVALAVTPLTEDQNNDLDFLIEKAVDAINNSDYESALFYFNEILKQDPNNYSMLNNKGGVLIELERYEEALEIFEKALEINPDFVEAINNKAITLANLGENFDALSTFHKAYKIDPENLITIKNMAEIVEEMPFIDVRGYAKIEVRTHDERLVGYTEAHRMAFQYPLAPEWLESKAEWKLVEIDGRELEVLQISKEVTIKQSGLYALTTLGLDEGKFGIKVLEIIHNGFLVKVGDKVSLELILFQEP